MIDVQDFKKLIKLEEDGYHIYVDGEEVHGLHYDKDVDWEEFVDGQEAMACTFTYIDCHYSIIHDLVEFKKASWTVEKHTEVNWREL